MKRFVTLQLLLLTLVPLTLCGQNRWRQLPPIEGSAPPSALVRDRAGILYMIANGLHRSDDQGRTWIEEPVPSGIRNVTTLAIDSTGALLAGGITQQSDSTQLHRRIGGSGSTWESLSTFPFSSSIWMTVAADGTYYLTSLHFENTYRSTDRGRSWDTLEVGGAERNGLFALPNGRMIFLASTLGSVGSDDGVTWEPIAWEGLSSGAVVRGGTVVALDSLRVVALITDWSGSNSVQRSSDGGRTWSRAALPPNTMSAKFSSMTATSDGDLIVQSESLGIYRSDDVASSWSPHGTGPNEPIVAYQPIGDDTILAAATGGPFLSTDEGRTWRQSAGGLAITEIDDVATLERGIAVVSIGYGARIYTPESGSWRMIASADDWLHSIERLDDDRLIAGSDHVMGYSGVTVLTDVGNSRFGAAGETLMSSYPFDKVALGGSNAFTIVTATYDGGVVIARQGESNGVTVRPDSVGTIGTMTRLYHYEGGSVFTWAVGRLFRIDSLFAADPSRIGLTTIFDGEGTALTTVGAGSDRKLLVGMRNRIVRSFDDGSTWEEMTPLAENLVAVSSLFARDGTIYLVTRDDDSSSDLLYTLYRHDPNGTGWIVEEEFADQTTPFTLHEDLSGGIYVVLPRGGIYGNAATSSVEERAVMPWSLDLSLEMIERRGE